MKFTDIKTIAVLGAGTMGQGIAQVCASAGFRTLLFDSNPAFAQQGIAAIERNAQAAREKGRLSEDQKQQIEKNLLPVDGISNLAADLIIEAVSEDLEVKQRLFQQLEQINGSRAILATNTSSLSVTQIASVLKQPRQCLGLHFFNPADRMKLVEIVAGVETAKENIDLIREFSMKIGKVAVLATDSPGFIVNRVARHFYLESLKLLEEQVASAEEIDALLRSAGFKMGPFELMDLIGVDINYAVTQSIYQALDKAPRFAPSPIQKQKVESGQLGRKTGKGFYEYPEK